MSLYAPQECRAEKEEEGTLKAAAANSSFLPLAPPTVLLQLSLGELVAGLVTIYLGITSISPAKLYAINVIKFTRPLTNISTSTNNSPLPSFLPAEGN